MNEGDGWDEGVLRGIVTRAEDKVIARGQAIVRRDIRSVVREGSRIRARVRGAEMVPYRVDINAQSGEHACTCPYDWGEVCKHTVAIALLALNEGEAIEESRLGSLESGDCLDLSALGEDDAIAILEGIKQKFPHVAREFAAEQMHELEYGDPDDD